MIPHFSPSLVPKYFYKMSRPPLNSTSNGTQTCNTNQHQEKFVHLIKLQKKKKLEHPSNFMILCEQSTGIYELNL